MFHILKDNAKFRIQGNDIRSENYEKIKLEEIKGSSIPLMRDSERGKDMSKKHCVKIKAKSDSLALRQAKKRSIEIKGNPP